MEQQLFALDSLCNSKMEILSQITIDLVENTLCDFEDEDFNIGAQIYKINNVLEVIKPGLILDIAILSKLRDVLSNNNN